MWISWNSARPSARYAHESGKTPLPVSDEWIPQGPREGFGNTGELKRKVWARNVCSQSRKPAILGCMKRNVASRSREVIALLYSALVRSQLEYFIQLWDSKYKKDTDLLMQVQRRAMKVFKAMEYIPCEERLKELKLFSMWKRNLRDFSAA